MKLGEQYLKETAQTESNGERPTEYYALGLAGETGELVDLIKKELFHGKAPDRVGVLLEAGDVLWYLIRTLRRYGWTLEEALAANIQKLAKRYPDGYSHAASAARVDAVKP